MSSSAAQDGPSASREQLERDAASSVVQLIARFIGRGWEWAKSAHGWEKAAAEYVHRWIERWGQIKPLGADRPIPLHQIYVQLRAVPRSQLLRFASIDALEQEMRETGGRLRSGSERRPAEELPQSGFAIANAHPRLNILGAPGSGKSTFLRRLGLETLLSQREQNPIENEWIYRGRFAHSLLPVLVELRSLKRKTCKTPEDVVSLLGNEFENASFPASLQLVENALNDGALLVLLDGVDEIPSGDLDLAVTAIRDFISQYPKCRYVISCRTAFYRDWFSGFHDYVLAEFQDEDVVEFARNWFSRPEDIDEDAAQRFVSSLFSADHRATRELAGSPLLLTFLCLVFRRTQGFPGNRALLYREALHIYLKEWNASKFVHNEPIYRDLSPEMEIEMLKELAGPAFLDGRVFFTTTEVTTSIRNFLSAELNAPKSMSPGEILEAIAIQQGLLIERARQVWSFSHLTIQEFLAASWFLGDEGLREMVLGHSTDARWREIFLLTAGLTKADRLIKELVDHAARVLKQHDEFLSQIELAAEGDWGRLKTTPSAVALAELGEEDSKLLLRGCYFALVTKQFRVLAPLFNALGLKGHAINETSEGGIASIVDNTEGFAIKFDLIADLRLSRPQSHTAITEIEAYAILSALVLDCKQAALRVTRGVWHEVVKRMFRPNAVHHARD